VSLVGGDVECPLRRFTGVPLDFAESRGQSVPRLVSSRIATARKIFAGRTPPFSNLDIAAMNPLGVDLPE
jgi:hypothetical protein